MSAAHPTADVPQEYVSVEALVRGQLARALGGLRGVVEGAVPTIAFTVTWLTSRDLQLALVVSIALAVIALVVRLVQRQTVQFVLNAAIGIGIGGLFAARSGEAIDALLPGILYNAAYGVVMVLSVAVGWPLIGFMIGSVTGDATAWHRDKQLVRLCSRLTLVLAVPCVARVLVQYPLYVADAFGWLATAKIFMGWPLQVAALAVMAYLLGRNHTPIERSSAASGAEPTG